MSVSAYATHIQKFLPLHIELYFIFTEIGDLTKYGIRRAEEGTFYLKLKHDVGTTNKIKIKVPRSAITLNKDSSML